MERSTYTLLLLITSGVLVAGQTESPCVSGPCRNGGLCFTLDDPPYYRCNCQSGYSGYDCTQAPSEVSGIANLVTFIPILGVGALQQLKIREIPGIPIILDILQDMLTEFTPCAASCLIDSNILEEIYDDIMYMNGTYLTCLNDTISRVTTMPERDLVDFFTDKSLLCPVIEDAYECIAKKLNQTCGSGLRTMMDRIFQKTDILDCSQQSPNNQLNIYECALEPIIRPLVMNNSKSFEEIFQSFPTCLNESENIQRLAPAGSWLEVYGEEENSGFPTICGAAEDVVDCAVNTLRLVRDNDANCAQFERTIYENLNSLLEMINCFNNGTAAFQCLADPDFTVGLLGANEREPDERKRRKRAVPSLLKHCLDIWTNDDLGNRIEMALPNLQTELEKGNLHVIAEAVAKETCGDASAFVECIVANAFLGKPECKFITDGVKIVTAPILEAYNTLGGCGRLTLDNAQRQAVSNCSCLAGFPPGPLDGCPIPGDKIQNIIFTLVVRHPWNDTLADKPCSEIRPVRIVCQELELLGNNLDIAVAFLGIAPNEDDEIALLYEAEVLMSKIQTVESALEGLVNFERVQTVQVSNSVDVKEVVNRELAINNIKPRMGAKAGGTPVTITGYFLENIDLITIGNIDCLLQIRSPVVYICTTGQLLDSSLVEKPLDVKSPDKDFGLQFSYLPDPIIVSVEPLKSIITGGATLTVAGAYFDSVVITRMVTTVESLETGKSYVTLTDCSIRSSTELLCPTAPIVLSRLANRRRRRQAAVSVNAQENVRVRIAFVLDGVEEYRNLTGTSLEQYSELTIYADPVIQTFSPSILTFTSSWPVNERYVEVKGKDLLVGLRKEEYIVRIGEALCNNMVVQDNLIVCEPPIRRPQVAAEDDVGYNKIPVKLFYANQVGDLGHLSYIQNIWEYPPGRYGIIGGICGLVVIIILIIIGCLCKRRKLTHDDGPPGGYPSAQQHLNLAQRVKRWSRKSPKRFSSFIPTGKRTNANYAPSSYDGGYPGTHQPYWDHY